MDNILLVTKSEKINNTLIKFLNDAEIFNITAATCGNMARRLLQEKDFSLCIIDTPVFDENASQLALYIVQNFTCACLLLVSSSLEDDISSMVEDFGIMVVSKPVNPHFFYKMLKFALSSSRRIQDKNSENIKLQFKLEELKIVNRAKLVLVEKLKLTEMQAHKYIEKQAMDLRINKKTVAENILKIYES